MNRMTWQEFKEYIDRQIQEQGIPEDAKVHFVDISYPCDDHDSCIPNVFFNKKRHEIAVH